MLINGLELNSLGIQLFDRVLYSNDITTSQEWLDGDIQPTFIRQQDGFKTIKLDFLVLCSDEDEAYKRISKLTALLKKAIIKFDDLDLFFDVNIVSTAEPDRLKNGNFIVSYVLNSDYGKGQREIYTTNANMTNAFKLIVAYYKNSTTLLSTESITIRASAFDKENITLKDLGIDVDKFLPEYYNSGIATNLNGIELTYENLQTLQALVINYAPISYNINVSYYMDNGEGLYNEILSTIVSFTQAQLTQYQTVSQLVKVAEHRPAGYRGRVDYDKLLTIEDLILSSPISVFYDKIDVPRSKNVLISYKQENDEGEYEVFNKIIINVEEEKFYDGSTLKDFINVDGFRPNPLYYNLGYVEKHSLTELVSFDSMETAYTVIYTKAINTTYVEYYAGIYPDWHRLATTSLQVKYKTAFENSFNILTDIGLDLNKYQTAPYHTGALYNVDNYLTYNDVINAGVLQVYYTAIDYPININYYLNGLDSEPVSETLSINALMFFGNPILSDIIPIAAHRPEGYQFNENLSYNGEITLAALTAASPITIVYEEITASRTKNVIVRYKQELTSASSTIATNLITVSEADVVGGTRLKDIINLNAYKPEFYESGVIDGASSTAVIQYDDINSSYDVLYLASTYNTPVRYYLDKIEDTAWVGSSVIQYRVIDFASDTTLYDFGLSLNAYKPTYASDGELLYTGPITFTALREVESINVLYKTSSTPGPDDPIDYPHRFLFLQHNDLGDYEHLHPEWTMNHAFINTGISADDMSKLTVVMECARVDKNVPLYQVNAGYGYLFGSYSPLGAYYMRYNNQTMYGENLTGVNVYEAKAGAKSASLIQTEEAAIGFSENSGIYSSAQEGYSRAVFTYSSPLATDGAQMPYPLYLFANNFNNSYAFGLAGIGIYGCRIYYNDALVRDFIPVQFYDKIGDLVAPSNCLYDKITKTFFEDETKLNSFNIIDDDRYQDDNLAHKIGHCYVNYYKGNDFIKTVAVYFRGDEFSDGNFDLYERFAVDKNQPQYCKSGVIENITSINVSFDGLNNQTFKVSYEPIEALITVNYYREDNEVQTLIKTEQISLVEKDFYQVPTFGDLVRINKYKPEGYETDFVYAGSKVSLSRVIENSPYNIVYKPIAGEVQSYSTLVKYIKKVYGVRKYETIGTKILNFDQSNFRDGEYIDFYINKNEMKPEKYYVDGAPYQWFEMDERLDAPEKLKELYTIVYMPETQYLDINYYVNSVEEENLVASADWSISIDELDPRLTYSIAEILPNDYINKYKPVRCAGGQIQNADVAYTFETLVAAGAINIIYKSIVDPDDPTTASYERKIIGFGHFTDKIPLEIGDKVAGGCIPYIDLGYRPKELGRLRIEIKAVAESNGFLSSSIVKGGWQDSTYAAYCGYKIPRNPATLGDFDYYSIGDYPKEEDKGNFYSSFVPNQDKGHFCFYPHIAQATGWVFTAEGPQYIDGQIYYTASAGAGVITGQPAWKYYGQNSTFRRGLKTILDENWEEIDCYKAYGYKEKKTISSNWIVNYERFTYNSNNKVSALANPITTVLDAYNGYWSSYSEEDSNHSPYEVFTNEDQDIFEARLQPKGTISLFRTTNPLTGKVNIMAHELNTRAAALGQGTPLALQGANPYTGDYKEVKYEVLVQTGTDANGNPIFQSQTQTKNVAFASFPVPVFPQLNACAIWGVKIWDRDRLVRDLIPVAKGDKIYDYTMPENGMFDLITEIFFGNSNNGGEYTLTTYLENENKGDGQAQLIKGTSTVKVEAEDVLPFWVCLDPCYYGKITMNYYDYDYSFINNQFVDVPTWYSSSNTTFEEIVGFNDYKPDDFHLDGFLDIDDPDSPIKTPTLKEIYDMGSANVYYKLKTFTKTVVYYRGDYRVGSKDIMYSLEDIKNAKTLSDLGINLDLYWTEDFAHGEVIFNEDIIKSDNIQEFIDAPSPIVVYKKLTKAEAPNLFYVEYYRGGASDETLITPDPNDENYFDCNLDGVVLNPNGAIKYYNHYHSALYEDEKFDYFIPYQVKVINKYIGIHRGPARKFPTLATIVKEANLTIIEERNGWGRLKEYPVGWIMLNSTEPITGPGQNPAYDVPNENTATIPFATEVHINKMTVDRLWCYVPAVQSWVKAEDLSYNQSGKLYNGLGITVIHLDSLDFSNITSLNDMGIYPNAKALYFHEKNNYTYSGEYTYDAFSNLHSLDFIYPETVYNYTCLYYKDNVMDRIEAGQTAIEGKYITQKTKKGTIEIKAAPSATANTVKSTYWNGLRDPIVFYITGATITDADGNKWYPVRQGQLNYDPSTLIYEGYVLASTFDKLMLEIQKRVEATETITNKLGSAAFSCSIGDWNPDWDVFIATSWQQDKDGNEIAPDLYRDTELSLTWDYFGFDKNLFKPDGYADGIYLWNPRTWDNTGDVHFTFQELVRMGTQYVLYPCVAPKLYKILVDDNIVEKSKENTTYWHNISNPGIPIDLRLGNVDIQEFADCILDDEAKKVVDYTIEGELNIAEKGRIVGARFSTDEKQYPTLITNEITYSTYLGPTNTAIQPGYNYKGVSEFSGIGEGYSFISNLSNFRKSPTAVYGFANIYEGKPYDYYIYQDKDNVKIPIHYNTNLEGYNRLQTEYLTYIATPGSDTKTRYPNLFLRETSRGVIYSAQSYQNFLMKHYWVPVPKGLWYKYNGVDLRIPENGMLDLITGRFEHDYRMSEGPITSWHTSSGTTNYYDVVADGMSYIFRREQRPVIGSHFDYFDSWTYNSTDVDYIVQANNNFTTYRQPDLYALATHTITSGLVFPVSRLTSDSANRVVGEWYFSGDSWLESKNTSIYSGQFDKSKLNKLQQNICLIAPKESKNYYVYLNPMEVAEVGQSSDTVYPSNTVLTVYYNFTDKLNNKYYFDGMNWIPEQYTSFNTTDLNKNYAVVPDVLSYYSMPIEDEEFVAGQYHYGERITVPYVATQNDEWGFTGLGWIKLNSSTVSEIV